MGSVRNVDYLEKYDINMRIVTLFKDVEDTERSQLVRGLATGTRSPSPEPRRGIIDWFSRRLRTPEPKEENNPIESWLADNLIVKPGSAVHCHRFSRAFEKLMTDQNRKAKLPRNLSDMLRSRGYTILGKNRELSLLRKRISNGGEH